MSASQRVGGWILARRECVGAVRRSGDWLQPLSPFLSRPLRPLPSSLDPRTLSSSLTQRDYCREYPGGQSVRRQPPRRRDAPLSLSLFRFFRLSRWRPQHRDVTTRSVDYPSHREKVAVVNFPTNDHDRHGL